jgi:hypothetical protein
MTQRVVGSITFQIIASVINSIVFLLGANLETKKTDEIRLLLINQRYGSTLWTGLHSLHAT